MNRQEAMNLPIGTLVRIDGVTFKFKKDQRQGIVEKIEGRGTENPLISVRLPDGRLEFLDATWIELPHTPPALSTGLRFIEDRLIAKHRKQLATIIEDKPKVEITKERDLLTVIDAVIARIPKDSYYPYSSLVLDLKDLRYSVVYTAPESRACRWKQLENILTTNLLDPAANSTPTWMKDISDIVEGRNMDSGANKVEVAYETCELSCVDLPRVKLQWQDIFMD